jgi:lysophospholipase L1-like esterase
MTTKIAQMHKRGWMSVALLSILKIHLFAQLIAIEPELHMLALGDSYTIGESVHTNERWPHQLVAELRKAGIKASDPDYIATTGWTTRDLLNGIADQLDRDKAYNLVTILIGVNNQYQGLPFTLYEPELREIITFALDLVQGDKSRVLLLSIPDYAYTPFGKGKEGISTALDAYNAVNMRLAREYQIPRVDVTPLSRKGLEDPDLVAGDGLHPSASQYKGWVREIRPLLKLPE